MSLLTQLDADLKTAMLARDEDRKRTLRSVKTAITNAVVEKRGNEGGSDVVLGDEEVLKLIHKQASQRRDSIAEFNKAGRSDLVAIEQAELAILQDYLPQQLDAEAVRAALVQAISETGATSAKDLGLVMRTVMARLQGQADGKLVNQLARDLLA